MSRWLLALSMSAAASSAGAEPPGRTLWIAPFQTACLDDGQLADLVRRDFPAVRVAMSPRGARAEAYVSAAAEGLLVRVELLDADDHPEGSEVRLLRSPSCDGLGAIAAVVIARALTPLQFRALPRTRPSEAARSPATRAHGAVAPEPPPPAPTLEAAPAVQDLPATPDVVRPTTAAIPDARPSDRAVPATSTVTRQMGRPVRRPHPVELELDGAWIFPLDGAPSAVSGDLAVGYGWSRVGVELRVGVAAETTSPVAAAQAIAIHARRIPLALEAWLDLPIRRGAFRAALGPSLSLWRVHAAGLADTTDALVAQPGATLRVAYRYEVGRFAFAAGLAAGVGFSREALSVAGLGVVGRLPLVELSPYLAVAARP